MYTLEGRGDYPTVGVSGPQAVIGWWWVVSSHLNCHCPPQLNSHHHHLEQFSTIESIWGSSILCIDSCHWQQDNERLNGVKRGFCSLVLCGGIIYGAILSTALKYPILDILYEWPSSCIHGDSNFDLQSATWVQIRKTKNENNEIGAVEWKSGIFLMPGSLKCIVLIVT